MASGFQNKNDQLTPNYYRVIINTSGYSTTATDNNSGGVEAWDHNYFATLNTTTDNSIRRARGNLRWQAILDELSRFNEPILLDVTVKKVGPTDETVADDTAVSVSFTVGYPQEEYVYGGWLNLTGGANLSDGATPLDGKVWDTLSVSDQASNLVACIKEAVTRGITRGGAAGYARRYRTVVVDPGTGIKEQRDIPVTIVQPDTPANIWATLTVTQIDTMTQQTSN